MLQSVKIRQAAFLRKFRPKDRPRILASFDNETNQADHSPIFVAIAAFSQSEAAVAQLETASAPDLNLVLQSLERVEQQNPALSRAHEVTRHYKAFHGDDAKPSAEIIAQISFAPPHATTFKIIKASGQPRGEKIVSDILEQETEPVTERDDRGIKRKNYDFVFFGMRISGSFLSMYFASSPSAKRKGCYCVTSG